MDCSTGCRSRSRGCPGCNNDPDCRSRGHWYCSTDCDRRSTDYQSCSNDWSRRSTGRSSRSMDSYFRSTDCRYCNNGWSSRSKDQPNYSTGRYCRNRDYHHCSTDRNCHSSYRPDHSMGWGSRSMNFPHSTDRGNSRRRNTTGQHNTGRRGRGDHRNPDCCNRPRSRCIPRSPAAQSRRQCKKRLRWLDAEPPRAEAVVPIPFHPAVPKALDIPP